MINKRLLSSSVFIMTILLNSLSMPVQGSGLKINEQVIETNDQNGQHQVNTAYQVLPDLFLSAKTEQVQKAQKAIKDSIQQAQSTDFLTKIAPQKESQRKIQRRLTFKQLTAETSDGKSQTVTSDFSVPTWIWWVIIGGIISMASVFGIYIGKKQARFFRRRD